MDGASHIFLYRKVKEEKQMKAKRKTDFGDNVGSCRLERKEKGF